MQAQRENAFEQHLPAPTLRMVFGMVNDKDVSGVLSLLPQAATYYFCQASVKRALPADEMETMARQWNLRGSACGSVVEAYQKARAEALPNDVIFIGGSSFVVADILAHLQQATS